MQTLGTPRPPSATTPPAPSARRLPSAALVLDLLVPLLVVSYLVLMRASLTHFPPLNNDEGREADLSWVATGLQTGAERMNAFRGFGTWGTGGLQGATTVLLFRLFGLGVFQARLTSLLWGGLLLLVVYWLGRRYWGREVGLGAATLLAVSDPFLLATHVLRPDIQVVALTLLALALVERGLSNGQSWPPILAGLLLGLSFDTHMNTLGFMPFAGAALLTCHGRDFWRKRVTWLLLLGLGLAAAYYLAVRVLPDPGGYLAGFRYWVGVDKTPPLVRPESSGLVSQIQNELLRYADYFGITSQGIEEPGELALVLFGLVVGVWRAVRGSRPDRTLLLGLLGAAVFSVFAVSAKTHYYMVLTYPVYALLIVAGFWQLLRQLPRLQVVQCALAGVLLFAIIVPLKVQDRAWDKYVRGVRYRAGQDYYALTGQLDQLIGPRANIMAPPLYWFGLHDHEFTDIFVYERVHRQYGYSPIEFLEAIKPDVVITDAKIATDKQNERELYRALDDLVARELIVRHKNYGDVAIYRLKWS